LSCNQTLIAGEDSNHTCRTDTEQVEIGLRPDVSPSESDCKDDLKSKMELLPATQNQEEAKDPDFKTDFEAASIHAEPAKVLALLSSAEFMSDVMKGCISENGTDKVSFKCYRCGLSYVDFHRLMLHLIAHREGDRIADALRAGEKVERPDLPSCPVNDEKIFSPEDVKNFSLSHSLTTSLPMKMKSEEIPTESTLCTSDEVISAKRKYEMSDAQLALSGSLKNYLKRGKGTFHCSECPAKFTQNRLLVVHRRIHLNRKPFVCKICKKAFLHGIVFREHMRVHRLKFRL